MPIVLDAKEKFEWNHPISKDLFSNKIDSNRPKNSGYKTHNLLKIKYYYFFSISS